MENFGFRTESESRTWRLLQPTIKNVSMPEISSNDEANRGACHEMLDEPHEDAYL